MGAAVEAPPKDRFTGPTPFSAIPWEKLCADSVNAKTTAAAKHQKLPRLDRIAIMIPPSIARRTQNR
jgi:hypothetical protein